MRKARVLLLGAGGAARAVLRACLDRQAAAIDVYNRTPVRAARMVEALVSGDLRARVVTGPDPELAYTLVVNATSLGLKADDPLPLDLSAVTVEAAVDLAYGPRGTPWTRHASSLGVPSTDGLEMLVQQAGLSLARWFVGIEPPFDAMREAARAGLSARPRDESWP